MKGAQDTRYCRDCHYPVQGWSSYRCPECGSIYKREDLPNPTLSLLIGMLGIALMMFQPVGVEIPEAREAYITFVRTITRDFLPMQVMIYAAPFPIGGVLTCVGIIRLMRNC